MALTVAMSACLPAGQLRQPALAATPAAAPQPAAQTVPDAALVLAGKKLYVSYCERCHGLNMVNTGQSFDLRTFPLDDHARFLRSVTLGLRAMPAWGSTFNPQELDALWAYVRSGHGS